MAAITKTTSTGITVDDAVTGTASKVTNKSQSLGKEAFMQLLIAQMKNQDPLNPTDSSQSIAQMAQFSSLEQMQNLNSTMTNMYSSQKASTLVDNAVMIGKTVTAKISDGTYVTGVVNSVGMADDGITPMFSVTDKDKKTNVVEAANIISIAQS